MFVRFVNTKRSGSDFISMAKKISGVKPLSILFDIM